MLVVGCGEESDCERSAAAGSGEPLVVEAYSSAADSHRCGQVFDSQRGLCAAAAAAAADRAQNRLGRITRDSTRCCCYSTST